jgi:G3E family GTPase
LCRKEFQKHPEGTHHQTSTISKEYWRQRYTIRWTKLGDQSTKIFHAAATERYRINTITSIDTNDGRTLTAHADKASFIWEEYRSRLSCSNHTQMVFNLQELIQEQDLQNITTPFTKEDIDDVIKEMPSDKAPGPDGFSGTFIKKMLAYHQRRFLQPMF